MPKFAPSFNTSLMRNNMILFFGSTTSKIFAVLTDRQLDPTDIDKLVWLFGEQPQILGESVEGVFIGPRAAMVTPWSTNATEITQNMGISGIVRIEEFEHVVNENHKFDPMLSQKYEKLDQGIFTISIKPKPVIDIHDISKYNQEEGLALNEEEISYLEDMSKRIGRKLTDSEVFGFSQVNSEHCRHKIFNGIFIIDGEEQDMSLFQMIKKTSKENPNEIVSAYKDNVAFIKGPKLVQFAPGKVDQPDYYQKTDFDSVLSIKAETHNFPTTVEPFNGAATGSGGEIRDRMAGGRGSIPMAGTAVYMTSYSRLAENRNWESGMKERNWLYQTPLDILIKASNGASDFGNKFGQPLISGSLLTFEHTEHGRKLGYDKVIMLAGGIGYGNAEHVRKGLPKKGDRIVVMGGDNYRIGMGGAAVSSADTGEFSTAIELNAVQRSNPEMQKRVSNVVRSMVECSENPIVSIHDHGAGGHLNCLSELVEDTGGSINMDKLPVGDPTLSAKELIGNESQERMGLVIDQKHIGLLEAAAKRERAPIYNVGEVTGDMHFSFSSSKKAETPMDLDLSDMFGSSPKTYMKDQQIDTNYQSISYSIKEATKYIKDVLRLEAVACKDWLTNKVDRCVGGLVAKQQCVGPLQLPLNNCGVMALDYDGKSGFATAIGHSPISGLIDPVAGSRNAIAESLTNIIWAPLEKGLQSVSLSANWMWPCKNPGEDARLYAAVKAVSEFAIELGINIPTGKDSLSMKQKYPEGEVISPGTVVISAAGHCSDRNKIVEPVLNKSGGDIYYIGLSMDEFRLGGSSFAQTRNAIGEEAANIKDSNYFSKAFNGIQQLINEGRILAGHDISSGGLVTALLEMCFSDPQIGAKINLNTFNESDLIKLLFAENSGIVIQLTTGAEANLFSELGISAVHIGEVSNVPSLQIKHGAEDFSIDIAEMRDVWYETSYLLDKQQSGTPKAKERFENYKLQPLSFSFPNNFSGDRPIRDHVQKRPIAAVLREQGSNSEREMAHALYLAGFDVRDVHMTDLISGRETLEDVQFLGAVGGFSNSDVLGSAKGWAGSFIYNEKANQAMKQFFMRKDVLSVGICNGCQLFMELDLINPGHEKKGKMLHNESHKHECGFVSVTIPENNSVMLSSLAGTKLGIWISHGEGKFDLPLPEDQYNIVAKYAYHGYPGNPNGSSYDTAMLASSDGRHLATMPHLERSMFSWNWAHYPADRNDDISPWIEAFINARKWLEAQN